MQRALDQVPHPIPLTADNAEDIRQKWTENALETDGTHRSGQFPTLPGSENR